jgi:hypothetical protein
MKRSTIILVSVPFLLLGFCALFIVLFLRDIDRPPEIGEHITSVEWLPAEATAISYFKSYGFTAYEFQIGESGFRDWAAEVAYDDHSEHVAFQPVTDVADLKGKGLSAIQRYNFLMKNDDELPEKFKTPNFPTTSSIEIENGLRGEVRRRSGGGYSIGYDRDTGTAYWQSNPR